MRDKSDQIHGFQYVTNNFLLFGENLYLLEILINHFKLLVLSLGSGLENRDYSKEILSLHKSAKIGKIYVNVTLFSKALTALHEN